MFFLFLFFFVEQVYWRTILDELNIKFSVPPKCVLEKDTSGDNPGGNWLPGAYLNPARNCLGNNGSKRSSDEVVIQWRNEGSDDLPINAMTLLELRSQVWYEKFSSFLSKMRSFFLRQIFLTVVI